MKKKIGVILLCALLLRVLLLRADVVVFDSDEAVVGLMARHILQGARPVFFYGQAYMGSLDAWLVAGLFALFGPSVWAIRVIQIALFLIHVALTFVLAHRWSQDAKIAVLSALLMTPVTDRVGVPTTALKVLALPVVTDLIQSVLTLIVVMAQEPALIITRRPDLVAEIRVLIVL